MSQRGKRGNRLDNENNAHQQTQQPPSKRRKGRPPNTSNGDADLETSPGTTTIPVVSAGVQPNLSSAASISSTMWQARPITGPQIYNRNSSEAPAELFRKDLISAMKLPDSEPLSTDEYWVIADQWKQEWERGVQVPVNPDSLPGSSVKQLATPVALTPPDFKLPKNKYLRITKDDNFSPEQHFLTNAAALADSACSYDLDQVDEVWLKLLNNERDLSGLPSISEERFERVIEELEVRCWDKIQAIMRNEEGLGIEYDENVICDVCRSPDSEEANEMVFCDNCNICVHQACYGITVIPSGQWLCRTCSMGKKPDCALCPNKGGAMKSTRSGKKWAHVSCALWIPEVSIGCVDKMEPITKISSIPQTRWSLLCILCRERVGACIQCSVSTCKTAYHVTCAFQHGLEMRAIIEEGNAEDGVKLRSYCLKHCNAKGKKEKGTNNNGSGSDDDCRRRKIRSDMTSEERSQARLMRSKEVEAEFDKHVNIKDISCHLLEVDQEAITSIYNYWILKRKSANNRPLIPPKTDDTDMVPNRQDQADQEKKVMFVQLRQDLERVRNLCYMVNRREKLSRTFFKMREQIFHKQIAILGESSCRNYEESVISAIIQANNGSSVYDKCYSSTSSGVPMIDVDELHERILGAQQMFDTPAPHHASHNASASEKGNKKGAAQSARNSFKNIHLNGITDRKATAAAAAAAAAAVDSVFEDCSSLSTNSESPEKSREKKKAQSYSKILEKHKRRKSMASSIAVDSSSDDEEARRGRTGPKKNPSLHQMEEELANDGDQMMTSSDDSELLMPFRQSNNQSTNKKSHKPIYSDSDSTDKEKTDNTVSDSQQQMFRTKAAMKEFSLQQQQQAAGKRKQDVVSKKSSTSPTKTATKLVPTSSSNNSSNSKHKSSPEMKKIVPDKAAKAKLKEKSQPVDSDSDEPPTVSKKESPKKHKSSDSVSPTKMPKDVNNKKFPTDLLVVPQRQAAKKASENMRSTNSYVTAAVGQKKEGKLDDKEMEIPPPKSKVKDKPERESRDDDREKERENKEKDKDKEKAKPRGRPPKYPKDEPRDKHIASRDKEQPPKEKEKEKPRPVEVQQQQQQKTSSAEVQPKHDRPLQKKSEKSDAHLVALPYVPQRQAAKKAAEHIKSGLGKVPVPDASTGPSDEKDVKEKTSGKNEGDGFREKCREKDKEKDQDKEQRHETVEKEEKSKEAKTVSPSKGANAQLSRTDRRSRGSISNEDSVKEKTTPKRPPPPRRRSSAQVEETSSSSESSSSSSCTSSSSESDDDENDDSVTNEKDEDIDESKETRLDGKKSHEPDESMEKHAAEAKSSPVHISDEIKHSESILQISTPKTVDSDVLCIDDSPDDDKKSTKSNTEPTPMDIESSGIEMDAVKDAEEKDFYDACSKKSPFERSEGFDEKCSPVESRETDESDDKPLDEHKMDVELRPMKENTQTLQQEMAQRKADLSSFAMGGFKNREASALDKLLDRREKKQKEQEESHDKSDDAMDIDDSLKAEDVDMKPKSTPRDDELNSAQQLLALNRQQPAPVPTQNVSEVIDIDSESGESQPSKAENEPTPVSRRDDNRRTEDDYMKPATIPLSLSSFLPPDVSKELAMRNEMLQQKPPSPIHVDPTPAVDVPMKQHQFNVDELPNANTKTVCDFAAMEPIFESKPSEDSTRETMNLVEKLRQNKYKRSSSKVEDVLTPAAEFRSQDGKTAFNSNADMFSASQDPKTAGGVDDRSVVANEKLSSIFDKDVTSATAPGAHKNSDTAASKPVSGFDQHDLIMDSAISFFDKSHMTNDLTAANAAELNSHMKKSSSFGLSAPPQVGAPAGDTGKTPEMFMPPENVSKVPTSTATPVTKSADSFDSLAQSNFFKGDFVDIRSEKDTLNISTNSSKLVVDCDYDENTRMQSPYTNPDNIWNENNLIQTRRSVSSSPSSISNDELPPNNANATDVPVCKANEMPMHHHRQQPPLPPAMEKQQQEQHMQPQNPMGGMPCLPDSIVGKNNFNLVSPFANLAQSQFPMQPHQQLPQVPQHPSMPFMNGADVMPYNYPENNHFNGPVSLFPSQTVPSNMNTQMPPFPSPSTPMFPSALNAAMPLSQNANSSIFGHMDKHKHHPSDANQMPYPMLRQPCAATFTSSSDNLALTQELVSNNAPSVPHMMNNAYNMPTPVDSIVAPRPANSSDPNATLNQMMNCDVMPAANNASSAKDSPSKRSSARFNQIKSPSMHKSPGKSPRNMELISRQHNQSNNQKGKYETSQRSKTKATRGAGSGRARGRGRGRGRMVTTSQISQNMEFESSIGSIAHNLAGTVYDLDFDEDLSTSVDLKSMRDRRRSFDSRANAANACDQKFTSPGYQGGKHRNTLLSTKSVSDVKSPHMSSNEPAMHTSHSYLSNIHPVLPGPVDMRTYNSGYENQSTVNQEAYNTQLLGVFASGMADQTLNEIDEEDEKKLQSDLKASGTYKPKPPVADIVIPESHASIETTSEEISVDSDNTSCKVSLSDSRNQLKLKIKGPLARPDNYNIQSTSCSLTQNLTSDNLSLQMSSASTVTIQSSSSTTGTSSLRRMRKKELLRQYWTQDMNMDDGASQPATENKTNNDPIVSRSVGIPKAVDSMNKDDYKDYASMDPRKRKRSQGMSRELRQLETSYESERPERRRSVCSSGSNVSVSNSVDPLKVSLKRRSKTKLDSPNHSETPKLKIKIGNHVETISDGNRMYGCPPKKRPTSNPPVPSFEILKRESMNFRKQVMADFHDDDDGAAAAARAAMEEEAGGAEQRVKRPKAKSKKSSRSPSHKKRKKEKRGDKEGTSSTVQSGEAPKLIIRFGNTAANTVVVDPTVASRTAAAGGSNDQSESSGSGNALNTASPTVIMPIKLKIARNSDGGGYVIGGPKANASPSSAHRDQPGHQSTSQTDDSKSSGNSRTTDSKSSSSFVEDSESSNKPLDPAVTSDSLPTRSSSNDRQADGAAALSSSSASASGTTLNDTENTSTMNVKIVAPNKAISSSNSDLKGSQTNKSSNKGGCPLLPINKDCEVR